MGSSSTRYDIVVEALARAGRDVGLRTLAEKMLNRMLRKWALEYKYPSLRKTGAEITLSIGSSSAALPDDFGAGMDSLMLGPDRTPIYERMIDEFVQQGGFLSSNPSQGRPSIYAVDENAGVFLFNASSDNAYALLPIYYHVPNDIPSGDSGDATKVWVKDDELVIQGLMHMIYQYTGDVREGSQYQLVQSMKADFRRGSVPIGGGVNKILLSRQTFKTKRF